VGPDDLAAIIFTSGTTGRSKGVMLSHRNILSDAEAMLSVIDIGAGTDRFLSVLPLSHCYECTCGFLAPLLAGARIYFGRGLAPSELLDDLRASQATFLLGVPLLYEKVVQIIGRGLRAHGARGRAVGLVWDVSRLGRPIWRHHLGRMLLGGVRRQAGLGSLKYLICGAAHLAPEVGLALEALGVKLLQGYGLTETSPVATLNRARGSNPTSVGPPLPGVDVRIHDPDATGTGEIWIRGPIVMRGYWDDREATSGVLADGWFRTGDLGRMDRMGHLFITGRSKNLIVSPGGKNISPEEIEVAALRSPLIAEIVVCGAPRRDGTGEEVFAFVHPDFEALAERGVSTESPDAMRAAIRAELDRWTAHLAAYKSIVRFDITAEPFVKTTTQKIKRYVQWGKVHRDAPSRTQGEHTR
jgi:long-chain acyl-CoA synthetase